MGLTPDGMAGQSRQELDNMRRAHAPTPTLPWELAALDADGNELYRTEGFANEDLARQEADMLNEGGIPDRIDDEVARFEAVEREE